MQSVFRTSARSLPVALLAVATLLIKAGATSPTPNSDEEFNLGLTFQKETREVSAPAEKTVLLERAVVHLRAAVAVRHDFYRAHVVCGSSLLELAQMSGNSRQQLTWAKAAEEEFAMATHCSNADWVVYHAWGSLLLYEVQAGLKSTGEQPETLREARDRFRAALKLVAYSGDRARIEIGSAQCDYLLAQRSRDPIECRTLYQQVASDLDAATRGSARAKTAEMYSLWGAAFLQLGKLNNDPMLLRQGIERLLTGLETSDGKDAQTNYNLACAYALLGQPDAGLRHLHTCLANDPQRIFYKIAANDQDLNGLRSTPEFNRIVGSESLDPSSPLSDPQPLSR